MRCDNCDCRIDPDIDVQYAVKEYHPLVNADTTRTYCCRECVVEAMK